MANEITTSVSFVAAKGGASINFSGTKTSDLNGTEMTSIVQEFTTSDSQAVSLGGVDQVQVLAIKNMDSTNSLTISLNGTHTQVVSVIPPGANILLYGTSLTLYGKSSAGVVAAFIAVAEN